MKAQFTFDMNDPDDREEFQRYNRSLFVECFIFEFSQWLRSEWKYNDDLTEDQFVLIEKIREKLFDLANEAGASDCL